ncbi:hypothetical protein [Neobacillus vireti]|uniref:hypothetical protein n=1 Tax=Neobacillus vireti TaxID=220686 RepID=UPI002FFE5DF7
MKEEDLEGNHSKEESNRLLLEEINLKNFFEYLGVVNFEIQDKVMYAHLENGNVLQLTG